VDLQRRNNVQVAGDGPATLVFSHGFGCDQTMWRHLVPVFSKRFRTVAYDLVGAGQSDEQAYDTTKYASLAGYAEDVNELVAAYGQGPVIYVGHSVSCMIGVLADRQVPGQIAAHMMVGPSPCYINQGSYIGGFDPEDIQSLLETLESNYLGWASNMAPVIMGAPGEPAFGEELTNSFCQTNPDIARQFARTTFLSDNRGDVEGLATPTLILQSNQDLIAPITVGEYLNRVMPNSTLTLIDNVGHCPHLSAPSPCASAMTAFLAKWALG
jgi:sigma-B regulation protein RsbQ